MLTRSLPPPSESSDDSSLDRSRSQSADWIRDEHVGRNAGQSQNENHSRAA